ncbi:MAG: hypothetical protein EA370_09050 [Wenzhouxiangella sp.]|nr:MAG: hypothetical protein EA370_09050 [Wenzhouxiangella sp.]
MNTSASFKPRWLGVMLLGLVLLPGFLAAATIQQTIELRPGWNAIFVEVQPEVDRIEQVFAGLPVASVWRWIPDDRPVAFIQDPDEDMLTIDGWFGYFPDDRPESILTNLFTITANQAYLVRLQGSQNRELVIEGRPIARPQRWRSNDFQFTGFHVDPANEPTFYNWFINSPAHQSGPIYRLDSDGQWTEVTQPTLETIRSGEAYWIYTDGRSSHQGPMPVELEFGDRVEFGRGLSRDTVMLRNRSGLNSQIRIRPLPSDTPVPLAVQRNDPVTQEIFWPRIEDEYTLNLGVDDGQLMSLGVVRANLFTREASQIFEFNNGLGARRFLEVRASALGPDTETVNLARARAATQGRDLSTRNTDPRYAGLWVGVASVDHVSEAQQGGVVPLPTEREFPMRILMHVDAAGTVRLLKEVIQMWSPGEEEPDPDNPDFTRPGTPGRYVLLTDDSLIPNYEGFIMRGGQAAGNRISTAAYDFEGQDLEMSGQFGLGGAVFGTIVIEPNFPTNPFFHRYHPDHDNLDAQFLNFKKEAYEVTRDLELLFSVEDPEGLDRPEWGDEELAGTYTEAISGLHRSTIFVSGIFRMRRVTDVPILNQ